MIRQNECDQMNGEKQLLGQVDSSGMIQELGASDLEASSVVGGYSPFTAAKRGWQYANGFCAKAKSAFYGLKSGDILETIEKAKAASAKKKGFI